MLGTVLMTLCRWTAFDLAELRRCGLVILMVRKQSLAIELPLSIKNTTGVVGATPSSSRCPWAAELKIKAILLSEILGCLDKLPATMDMASAKMTGFCWLVGRELENEMA